jgi:hypothetical protein
LAIGNRQSEIERPTRYRVVVLTSFITASLLHKKGATMADYFKTEQEIETVVSGFENCTTSKEGFTHVSHLTVATYYLINSTPEESFEKMRSGLRRFLKHHGVNSAKYSDRVTWAWIEQIRQVCRTNQESSLVETVNRVIARLGHSRMPIERDCEAGQVNE